jgi:hypothetical protein
MSQLHAPAESGKADVESGCNCLSTSSNQSGAYAQDGRTLESVTTDGWIQLWDVETASRKALARAARCRGLLDDETNFERTRSNGRQSSRRSKYLKRRVKDIGAGTRLLR